MRPKTEWNKPYHDCFCGDHVDPMIPHYDTPTIYPGDDYHDTTDETYGLDEPIFDYFGPSITGGKPPVSPKKSYLSTVQNCAFMSQQLSTKLSEPKYHDLRRLLQSTARLCSEQAALAVSNCVFAKDHALLTAKACDVTQATCQKFNEPFLTPIIERLNTCRDACYHYANRL